MIKSIQEFLQFIFKEEDSETFVFESPIEGSLLSFRLFWGGLFTFFYFIIGVLSLKIATVHLSISPVWPPTGIAILGMVLFGRPLLPFVFAGALAVNLYIGGNFGVAGLIALGNALESYVGFFVIAKVYQWRFYFQQSFLLLATLSSAIIAPIISASIGVLSLYYFGELPAEKIKISWFTWWTGDFVGALLIVPFYILSIREFRERCFRSLMMKKIWGGGIILLSLLGLYLTFLFLEYPQSVSWLFIIFLLLVLVGSLRSESFSLIYINLLCAVVVGVTLTGKGPFNLSQLNQNILNLEVFLTALIISNLGLISIFRSSSYRPFVFILIS